MKKEPKKCEICNVELNEDNQSEIEKRCLDCCEEYGETSLQVVWRIIKGSE